MPVTKYAGYYLGLLWVKRCPSFEGPPYWLTRAAPATSQAISPGRHCHFTLSLTLIDFII
jgi:hypothetical protein